MQILYEDNYLLVAEKPQGMLSQSDASGDEDLLSLLRVRAGDDPYPPEAVHRLDRGTGGVILYAKGERMAAKLSAVLREHGMEKEYLAVITGTPSEPCGEMRDFLLHDRRRNLASVVPAGTRDAKEALLSYEILETAETDGVTLSLVKVRLHTGCTHQIRVQFASRGLPLLGDGKYGKGGGRLHLWASRLAFPHPMRRKEILSLCSRPPAEDAWTRFSLFAGE